MGLPFKYREATSQNPRLLLIYGPPKIGKTPSMLKLEGNFLLDLEKRAHFFDGHYEEINDLIHLDKVIKTIIEAGKPYKYLTVDTTTKLNEWTDDYAKTMYLNSPICKKEYKQNPASLASVLNLPDGAGYFWARLAYGKWLEYIRTAADTIILICHVKDKFLVDNNGNTVTSIDVNLTGKLKEITCSRADAIGFLYRVTVGAENGKAISQMRINFNAGNEVVCGSTSAHLRGMDFEFYPEKNPEDWLKIFVDE
jgi:hypothetical protein